MNNIRKTTLFYILTIIFISLFTFSYSDTVIIPSTNSNFNNLTSISFSDDVLISLNHCWSKNDNTRANSLVSLSDEIENYNISNCIYTTTITLPPGDESYVLMLPNFPANITVLINDKVMFSESYKPGFSPVPHNNMVHFHSTGGLEQIKIITDESTNDFIINTNQTLLGSTDAVTRFAFLKFTPLLSFAVLITICFLHFLSLFLYNFNNRTYLTLGFLCMSLYIRTFISNYSLFFLLFHNVSFELYYSLCQISSILPLMILVFHIDKIFPDKLNKSIAIPIIIYILLYITLCFSIRNMRMPLAGILYYISLLALILLLIITTTKALINRKPKSVIYFITILFISVTSIVDSILFLIYHTYTNYYIYSYSFAFILFVNTIIRNVYKTYNKEIQLSTTYSSTIQNIKTEETNFLSSHLRPHFLFNALNIISGYSLFDKEKAKEITNALSIYLRQLFEHDNLKEMNSLYNELELVKAFAFIELERFPGLNIVYDIPEDLPDMMIPSLTLQPLLENAINHGIRKKDRKGEGTVIISIRPVNDYVFFSIKDNGAGGNESTLKKALSESKDGKSHTLIHISYRLKNLYNEKISVRSISGVGTFISFKIPLNHRQ